MLFDNPYCEMKNYLSKTDCLTLKNFLHLIIVEKHLMHSLKVASSVFFIPSKTDQDFVITLQHAYVSDS